VCKRESECVCVRERVCKREMGLNAQVCQQCLQERAGQRERKTARETERERVIESVCACVCERGD